jgi:HK97 gp10 family phage protein
MSRNNVELLGANKLIARLVRVKTGLPRTAIKPLRQVLTKMRDHSKAIVPVDTGSLRKSIRLQTTARPAGNVLQMGLTAGGYVTNPRTRRKVDYAYYVEAGTVHMTARPYFSTAVERFSHELLKVLDREVIGHK